MPSLDQFCAEHVAAFESRHQRRVLKPAERRGTRITRDGKEYISFACNDYLGLSQDPRVITAGQEALKRFGAGAGASRLITGNHPLYAPLEAKLAQLKGKEAALVFGSGYLTNLGVIPALVGKGDLILCDKLVHACLLDGAQLSGATYKRFKHNDLAHAEAILKEQRASHKQALILVDHIYSMDGDRAPLVALAALAKRYDAWLMADDAHGIGIVKEYPEIDLWMGTLSKAIGGYGGYVAASKNVIDYLMSAARSFVFSTGLPPAVCASTLAALEIMEAEPKRGERALALARRIEPQAQSAIVPIQLGSEEKALAASEALKSRGILAVAIRPPTVPPGTARLRLTFSAAHTDEDVEKLLLALKAEELR